MLYNSCSRRIEVFFISFNRQISPFQLEAAWRVEIFKVAKESRVRLFL